MNRRWLILSVAFVALAGLAFAAPSHAASTVVTTDVSFSVAAGQTVSGMTLTYSPAVDPISPNPPTITMTGGLSGITISESGNTVTLTWNAIRATTGSLEWVFSTATAPPIDFSDFAFTSTTTNITDTINVSSGVAPEPASFALLGIGVTGLFALRRFFKRASAA